MGALGLPGDASSQSRFVRGAFIKESATCHETEEECVSQFFHVLNAVEQVRGSVRLADGNCVMTVYSSCCNLEKGLYYYTTYENRQITAVDLHREYLDGTELISYPLLREQQFRYEN
jgi:choloylglycine hydrolase